MINTLSEFISVSSAEKEKDKWTVYVDGENKLGAINNCSGNNEFEAKEEAWEFYQKLFKAVKK